MIVIASRPFRLRSKCSICARRFESRRWSHPDQALSSRFLDFDWDYPSSLGPVPWIVSTLQCRQTRSTPVFFGKRELYFIFERRNLISYDWLPSVSYQQDHIPSSGTCRFMRIDYARNEYYVMLILRLRRFS